ncbi:MAG: glycosyltransferase family 39 protein, partial [Chloroflexi bacterium]|nr:glycosyltransferase family 39 protein [Chloroflexota bacterium]
MDRLWVVAVTALGGFLRVYQIGVKGLWLDEAFSVWLGWQPVGEMMGWLVRIDQHPPLYHLLLHFWMVLGDDPATVRSLSALCGTLTIPVVYLLGRRLGDDKVGLLAALVLAVSPFHVRFAQETRMYTLLTLNVSLALYALARLLTDPRSAEARLGQQFVDFWRGWRAARYRRLPLQAIETDLAWLGYVVFTAAALLTHNTAVFFPIAANIIVLLLIRLRITNHESRITNHEFLRNWLLAQVGVLLLWSPWLPAFAVQSAGVYREFWLPAPTWRTLAGVVGAFVSDFLPLPSAGACVVGVLYVGLALLGLVHFRRRPAHVLFLLVIFTTPFVGEWLVSLHRPIFYDRTLIWASLPLYLL